MKTILMASVVLALAACQAAPGSQAMARADAAGAGTPVIPAAVSRPIVEPEGNTVQCTAYPGPGSANACIQK